MAAANLKVKENVPTPDSNPFEVDALHDVPVGNEKTVRVGRRLVAASRLLKKSQASAVRAETLRKNAFDME